MLTTILKAVKVFSQDDFEVLAFVGFVLSCCIMSKHFKMYITITDIAEKIIDLSYLIKNFNSSKEVTVVSMFSDNIRYEFSEL